MTILFAIYLYKDAFIYNMLFHSSMSGFENMMKNFSQNEIRQMISKVSHHVTICSIVTVTQMIINKSKLVGQPIW